MKTSDTRKSIVVLATATVLGLAAAATLASASPSSGHVSAAAATPCPSPSGSSQPPPSGLTTIIPSLPTGGGGSSSASPSASKSPKPSTSATSPPGVLNAAVATDTPSPSETASGATHPSSSASGTTPSPCQTGGPDKIKSKITIEAHRHLNFGGVVTSSEKGCYQKRDVVLKKVAKGKDPSEGTDVTNNKGKWLIVAQTKTGGGMYYAIATEKPLHTGSDKSSVCTQAKSDKVKAR
ncbi:MAG: hypothetical protein ABR579_07220 [Actinomycetota bacterium]